MLTIDPPNSPGLIVLVATGTVLLFHRLFRRHH